MHNLLKRQLKRHFGERDFSTLDAIPPELKNLVDAVDTAYNQFDDDREMLERSLELTSQELITVNSEMRAVYERLIQSSADGIFAFDRDYRLTVWNPGMERISGLSQAEVRGKYASGFSAKLNVIGEQRFFREALEGKTVRVDDTSYTLPATGENGYLEGHFSPLLNEANDIIGGLAILRDVTERKNAERRLGVQYAIARVLAESERFDEVMPRILQAICESLDWELGEMWSVDAQANVLRYTQSWKSPSLDLGKFGADVKWMTFAPGRGLPGRVWSSGEPIWIADVKDDPEFVQDAEAAQARLHSAFAFPIRLHDKLLGVTVFLSRAIRQPDNELLKMFNALGSQIGQFIERKRVEDRLREAEARYRTLVEQLPAIIYMVSFDLKRTIYISPQVETMLGYTPQEWLADPELWIKQLFPADRERVLQEVTQHDASGEPLDLEYRTHARDGRMVWLQNRSRLLYDEGGQARYSLGGMFDISELKRAEEARRQSEARFSKIFHASPVSISISTLAEGRILDVNDSFLALIGYAREQVIGHTAGELGLWALPGARTNMIQAIRAKQSLRDFEVQLRTQQGDLRQAYGSVETIDIDGKPAIITMYHDITERRLAEAALHESERKLRLIAENATDVIFAYDMDRQLVYVNPAVEKLTGYTMAEIQQGRFSSLFHPDDDKEIREIWSGLFEGRAHPGAEFRIMTRAGQMKWCLSSWSALTDEQDLQIGVQTVLRDITERKHMEEALATERDLFNALMDTVPDMIYFKDRESRFVRINRAEARILGVQHPNDAVGNTDRDFFAPDHATDAFADEQRIVATGEPLIGKLEHIRRADGEFRWVTATKVPLRDGEGHLTGTVGISRDVTQQKQLEDELQRVKDYLETLIQSANDIIYTLDLGGHFTFGNRRVGELTGYAIEDWKGKHFLSMVVPEDCAEVAQMMRQSDLRRPHSNELRLLTAAGRTITVSINTTPIFEDGKLVGTLGIARDTTEEKRLERQIQDVKEYLESLISNAGTAIITFEPDGRVKTWNAEAETLFGYTAAEIVGQRDTGKLVPENRLGEARSLFERALAGEIVHGVTTQRLHKDGSRRDVLMTTSPVRDTMGQVVAVCLTGNDISTSVKLERVIRDERDRLDAILRSMAEGVLVTDAEYRLTLLNRAAEDIIGIPREQILDKHLDALTLPITRAELERQLSESPTVEVLRSKIRAWGTRMIEVNITALRDAHGQLVGTVSLVRDVTELMRVDEMKSEFVSLVSHELRTPLTSIKGYTDLIMAGDAGPINPEQTEFLNIVKTNIDRLVVLINDILDISRIEAGRIKLHPTTVNLTMLFGETIRSFKPQLEAKAQIVSVDLPKGSLQVVADRDRLSQILWNLVSNAHKYSPSGSRIRLQVTPIEAARTTSTNPEMIERRAPMVAIAIEDEGMGITPQDQTKLFTKFFRVDNSLTREIGGTGLGLAIVKNFVELQGGRVWVESPLDAQSGLGTRFTFTIPAIEEAVLTVPIPERA